ncbi:MAG: RDD family protein [Verrucomicrobia bacterium]|nr:RDD family protein [Verrucomicrobiota bacterium]
MKRNIHSFALVALAAGACVIAPLAPAKDTNETAASSAGSSVKISFDFGDKKSSGKDAVAVGKDFELKEGETASEVAVVGGNATIAGKVKGSVAVVFGSATLKPTAVVGHDVAVVFGSARAASNAVVRGNVVTVGGGIKAEPGFKPGGEQVAVGWSEFSPEWLKNWTKKGLLRGVLLPWSLMESWIFVAVALAFNILLSMLFARPLQTCADTACEKPVQSLLLGLLLLTAFGPVCLLLVISCVGILAIPFLVFAALVAMVFGFIAVYRVVGRPLARLGGGAQAERPLLALTVGTVICNLAYMLPMAGFIVWGLVMMLGFGAASLALFSRPKRQAPPSPPAEAPPIVVPQPVVAAVPPVVSQATAPSAIPTAAPAVPPLELTALSRPGFWMRIGAALLDCIVISLLVSPIGLKREVISDEPWFLLVLLAYLIGLWTWRGTTIGCIICGLKIVRTDGQPVTLGVAIVRALASLLSLAVVGLGFFWIAWDREKQAWHDKIAGTLVVRMPKGVSLI